MQTKIKLFSTWKPKPKLKLWAVWQKPKQVTRKDIVNNINKILKLLEDGKR